MAYELGQLIDAAWARMVDHLGDALKVIDYAHAEIHAGNHFKAGFQNTDMDNENIIELLFITPNTERWAHWTLTAQTAGGGAAIAVYEGAVASNNGTAVGVRNRNRNISGGNTTLVYHTPTLTSDGLKLSEKWIGGIDKKDNLGGSARGYSEFILKQNTKYLVRLTAEGNSMKGSIGGDWYEHTSRKSVYRVR